MTVMIVISVIHLASRLLRCAWSWYHHCCCYCCTWHKCHCFCYDCNAWVFSGMAAMKWCWFLCAAPSGDCFKLHCQACPVTMSLLVMSTKHFLQGRASQTHSKGALSWTRWLPTVTVCCILPCWHACCIWPSLWWCTAVADPWKAMCEQQQQLKWHVDC